MNTLTNCSLGHFLGGTALTPVHPGVVGSWGRGLQSDCEKWLGVAQATCLPRPLSRRTEREQRFEPMRASFPEIALRSSGRWVAGRGRRVARTTHFSRYSIQAHSTGKGRRAWNSARAAEGATVRRRQRRAPIPTTCGCTALAFALATGLVAAQRPVDEEAPWPRVRSTNGNIVTLNLPQVETWTSNSFRARAVVGVKPADVKKELLGVIWFEAHGSVDRTNRVVTLDRMEITKGRFPEATDNGSNVLALVRELSPGGARTVSLDYLITALGFAQAEARRGTQ